MIILTKDEIYKICLNDKVKVESNKEIDYDHYLAIMEAMKNYAVQEVSIALKLNSTK